MLIVSDTSPVSSLIQIGRDELLKDMFGIVCIPPAVRDELVRFHAAIPAFLEVREVSDRVRVNSLLATLDLGEAEAIVLAIETRADRLLVDEHRGRSIAVKAGVPVIGLLGVLLLARQRGHISCVKDCVDELRSKAGFYVADDLVRRILEAAGE